MGVILHCFPRHTAGSWVQCGSWVAAWPTVPWGTLQPSCLGPLLALCLARARAAHRYPSSPRGTRTEGSKGAEGTAPRHSSRPWCPLDGPFLSAESSWARLPPLRWRSLGKEPHCFTGHEAHARQDSLPENTWGRVSGELKPSLGTGYPYPAACGSPSMPSTSELCGGGWGVCRRGPTATHP